MCILHNVTYRDCACEQTLISEFCEVYYQKQSFQICEQITNRWVFDDDYGEVTDTMNVEVNIVVAAVRCSL